MDILPVIRQAFEKHASDIHIIVGNRPLFRIHGILTPVEETAPLTTREVEEVLMQLSNEQQRAVFEERKELDFGYTIPGVCRIRCNVAKQRNTTSMVIRMLPTEIPSLEELGLPEVCKDLIKKPRGLVVVSGTTGSGKSTTLSAMINHLNQTENRRLVTIEDPIEFVYKSNKCVITQRELGEDTHSFPEALRHVLRQDPDVILVGEMRDQETAAAALTIAETGHLILTTGHAPSAPQTIERIVDMFPPHERDNVQSRLASLLVAVMTQVLVPKANDSGRVVAIEIMLSSSAVRSNIRDGKIYQLPNTMVTQAKMGNILLDNALINLYRKRDITRDTVLAYCNDPDEIIRQIGEKSIFV